MVRDLEIAWDDDGGWSIEIRLPALINDVKCLTQIRFHNTLTSKRSLEDYGAELIEDKHSMRNDGFKARDTEVFVDLITGSEAQILEEKYRGTTKLFLRFELVNKKITRASFKEKAQNAFTKRLTQRALEPSLDERLSAGLRTFEIENLDLLYAQILNVVASYGRDRFIALDNFAYLTDCVDLYAMVEKVEFGAKRNHLEHFRKLSDK